MDRSIRDFRAGESTSAGRSVLDIAADLEKRQAFLRHLDGRGIRYHEQERYAQTQAYLLCEDCPRDLQRLKDGDFFFSAPFHYRVPKNASGKMRDVYAFRGREKYLLSLIAWVMHDFDDAMLPQGLYSFRRSVQARDFLKRVRELKDFGEHYVIKADISGYVGSIVPEKIIPQLEAMWEFDPALLELLKYLLLRRECIEKDGSVVKCEPGGMGGVPVANHFMNVYLTEADRYFYPRVPLYSRYSDDIMILSRNRTEAEERMERLLQFLEERQLRTNPEKTCLLMPGESVEILGFKVLNGKIDISDHALEKAKRKLRLRAGRILKNKKHSCLTDAQAAVQMIDYCNAVFFGEGKRHELCWARWYFPMLSAIDGMREIDRYAQDAIRFVMCGSMKRTRYRIGYEQLRLLGYKSLVHAYYHGVPAVTE